MQWPEVVNVQLKSAEGYNTVIEAVVDTSPCPLTFEITTESNFSCEAHVVNKLAS